MALQCLKSITLFPDGTFSGFTSDGNTVTSTKSIFEVIETVGSALQAPWMTKREAYEQAGNCYNVKIKFNSDNSINSIQGKQNKHGGNKKLTRQKKRLNRCLRYRKGKCVSRFTKKQKKVLLDIQNEFKQYKKDKKKVTRKKK